MEDDVSRRTRKYRRLHRSPYPQGGGTGEPQPTQTGRGEQSDRTAEQRYADAVAALNRIVSTRDFSPLPQVMRVLRATAGALADNDPVRAGVLNNLGSAAQLAYMYSRDDTDLQDASAYFRLAASTASADDPDLVLYLCNLALALTDLAGLRSSADEAKQAADTARRAAGMISPGDHRRVTVLVRLGNALKTHARLAGEPASDDESIDAFREAARSSLGQEKAATPSELLINLGSALLRRYERGTAPEDLNEGVVHLRAGIGSLPDGEPRRAALCHLATALRLRFRHTGELGDLHAAINELIGVIGVLESGHPLLGTALWNLACTTVEHVDSTGEPGQMRRVLRVLGPATRGMAADDPNRAVALAGLGALLRRHFVHGADTGALDSAVAVGEMAVEAAHASSQRSAVLNSLATTLITRFEHTSDPEDLDRAAAVADEAASIAPEDSTALHTAWTQQGVLAVYRSRRTSSQSDLESAIELFDKALAHMVEDAPERAAVATHLGRALQSLFQRTGRRKLYRWARRVLTDAAEQPGAPADQRLRAASLCGRLAAQAHRWHEATESFSTAVELLPLVTRGKRVVASPNAQQRWATITADAAACAMENGEPERAVELLEHGRAALLSDFLPASGELGDLHRWHPDIADEVVRLRRLLDRPPEEPVLAGLDVVSSTERRRQLALSWDGLVREVRHQDGHGQHLRVLPFDDLSPAGEDGLVVLVNVSRYRSDALIVFAGRVLVIPIPGASPESTAERAEDLLAAVDRRTWSRPRSTVRTPASSWTSWTGCGTPSPGPCWTAWAMWGRHAVASAGPGCGGARWDRWLSYRCTRRRPGPGRARSTASWRRTRRRCGA